ncbi:MAG: type 4a pilus biogenesis protein PilO [Azoarcus sp.]|jgi:type IV pilus assembly protein PilO|nr:type 4a pilus biogenesis protein PilO [Azoarcus sp.]
MDFTFDLQRLKNDFQGLNFEDPGVWPLTPRLVAFAALFIGTIVLGGLIDWRDQWGTLAQAHEEESTLRDSWLAKKRQAVNLDEYRRQLETINRQIDTLVKQLPGKAEMDSLLSDINQAGLGRGLQFDLFQPAPDELLEFYAAVPVKISVTGSYHDIGEFVSDVAKMPRIVTIKNLVLTTETPNPKNKNEKAVYDGRLRLNATAETYRYLEEDELARQQGGKK